MRATSTTATHSESSDTSVSKHPCRRLDALQPGRPSLRVLGEFVHRRAVKKVPLALHKVRPARSFKKASVLTKVVVPVDNGFMGLGDEL